MIDHTELRKGNKVKCKISNDAGIYTVLGVPGWGMDDCGYLGEPAVIIDRCPKQIVKESQLKPIKLSPDILEKCGFEKSEHYWSKTWGTNGVEIIVWNDYYRHFMFQLGKGRSIVLSSVHHLQNIFHSLTGEELTLNL